MRKIIFILLLLCVLPTSTSGALQDATTTEVADYSEDIVSALKQIDVELTQLRNENKQLIGQGFKNVSSQQRTNDIKFLIGMFSIVISAVMVSKLLTHKMKIDELKARKTAGLLQGSGEKQETPVEKQEEIKPAKSQKPPIVDRKSTVIPEVHEVVIRSKKPIVDRKALDKKQLFKKQPFSLGDYVELKDSPVPKPKLHKNHKEISKLAKDMEKLEKKLSDLMLEDRGDYPV